MEVSHGLKYIYLTCFLWIWVLYVSLGRWQEISKMELISDFFFIYSFVCLFIVRPLFFPYKRGRTRILRYACKTDQDDFTHWIYFWPSNLMEEISPISGINVLIWLREKCPYSEFLWSVRTEYGEIRSISRYPVQMWENAGQKNSKYGRLSCSDNQLRIKLKDKYTSCFHSFSQNFYET